MKAQITFEPLTVSLPLTTTWTDFPSKDDCAVIVYFTGCGHNCPGCQNPELQVSANGEELHHYKLAEMIENEAAKAHTKKIVLSGGDPYFQPAFEMDSLVSHLIVRGYEVCIYTGADIKDVKRKIPYATYYKCGKYDEQNKEKEWGKFSDRMVFVSKNQALYNTDGKKISVDNVYYFSKWDTFKAKIKKWFRVK